MSVVGESAGLRIAKHTPRPILRVLFQSLLGSWSIVLQELLNSPLCLFVLFRILEAFECAEVAFARLLERGDGKLWKLSLTSEGP